MVKVLGIDTSLRSTGVGVVAVSGSQMQASLYGAIKNKPKIPHTACLLHIHERIVQIIEEEQPSSVAIEGIFHCRNVKVAITLGQARGAAMAACALKGVPVYEYAPRLVKKGIVGTGAASKDQVGQMVKRLLNLDEVPADDPADALAIAICHIHHMQRPEGLGRPESI